MPGFFENVIKNLDVLQSIRPNIVIAKQTDL